jgi:hypothetical protein
MSRNLGLPYKPTNPRTVRGAKKRGWTIIHARDGSTQDLSWFALSLWCESQLGGYWVSSFGLRQFAFEDPKDAMMFKLKWG